MNRFIIYALSDPHTDEVRYIGKSSSGTRRAKVHMQESNLRIESNTYKTRWIKEVIRSGHLPKIEVIEVLSDDSLLNEAEVFWICQFRAWGFKLTNLTDGGEGARGYVQSADSKAKRAAAITGMRRTLEQRAKMRDAHKGKVINKETRIKISNTLRGKKQSVETKIKRRQAIDAFLRKNAAVVLPEMLVAARRPSQNGLDRKIIDSGGITYSSVGEAARVLGVDRAAVRRAAAGKQATCKGRAFRYV